MRVNSTWSRLVALHTPHEVEPVRRLRDSVDQGVIQYLDSDGERLAVRDPEPYGSLTGADRPELMRITDIGSDYSIFEVPEDTLSLKAITLGTGRHNTRILRRTYRQVGEALGRLLRSTEMPLLGVDDFAVVRSDARVLLTPPIHFGQGTSSPLEQLGSLSESLTKSLMDQWNEDRIRELSGILGTGISDAFRS